MSDRIDISNKDKAEVLAALFNRARPQGLGFLQYRNRTMSVDEARTLLETQTCFDYLEGRVMKINLSGSDFNPTLYDLDNGSGAAETALRMAGVL